MTKEEIIKIFEENHIAKGNATINATKLAEIFTKHETDLLKKFIEHFKQILNNEIWECEDEIDCEIHCGSLAPEEFEVWKAQRQVDIKRLKWAVENIDFELKLFLEE